jgi:hypothetical protein
MAKKLTLTTIVKRALIAQGWELTKLYTDKLKHGHKRKWVNHNDPFGDFCGMYKRIVALDNIIDDLTDAGYAFESAKWIRSTSFKRGNYWALVVKTKE